MRRYQLKGEYGDASDEEILAALLGCEAKVEAGEKGNFFELHPGEREIIESFVYHPKKLKRFLDGFKGHRAYVLKLIIKLLNRPVSSPD